MLLYGIAAQFLSIFILTIQLVIAYDSIVIHIDRYLTPIFDKSRVLLVIFGFIVPGMLSLFFCIYNLVVFSSACSLYFIVNLVLFIVCLLLIVITLMRLNGYAAPVASFIFVAMVQILTWSILSSTSHSLCSSTTDTNSMNNYFYRGLDTFIRKPTTTNANRHLFDDLRDMFPSLYNKGKRPKKKRGCRGLALQFSPIGGRRQNCQVY